METTIFLPSHFIYSYAGYRGQHSRRDESDGEDDHEIFSGPPFLQPVRRFSELMIGKPRCRLWCEVFNKAFVVQRVGRLSRKRRLAYIEITADTLKTALAMACSSASRCL